MSNLTDPQRGDQTRVYISTVRNDFDSSKHGDIMAFDSHYSAKQFSWPGRKVDDLEQFMVTVTKLADRIRADVWSLTSGDTFYKNFSPADGAPADWKPVREFIVSCLTGKSSDPDEYDGYMPLMSNEDVLDDIAWLASNQSTDAFNDRDDVFDSRWISEVDSDGELSVDGYGALPGALLVLAETAHDVKLSQAKGDEFQPFEPEEDFCDVRDESTRFIGLVRAA